MLRNGGVECRRYRRDSVGQRGLGGCGVISRSGFTVASIGQIMSKVRPPPAPAGAAFCPLMQGGGLAFALRAGQIRRLLSTLVFYDKNGGRT